MLRRVRKMMLKGVSGMSYPHGGDVVKSFISDSDFPYLISFPRTGSHWLRMMMEMYFKRPALTRVFFLGNSTKFTCYHTHDTVNEEITDVKRKNVLYLYRNAPETVYSLMQYNNEEINDISRIEELSLFYCRHLVKWLVEDNFTEKKTLIRYENLRNNLNEEFEKVCEFFDEELDVQRLENAFKSVSKDKLKEKTKFNKQIVNLSAGYITTRRQFLSEYSDIIYGHIYQQDERLKQFFTESTML